MKTKFNRKGVAGYAPTPAAILALAFILSCTSNIETPPPPLDNSSSSSENTGETSYAYCITADNICLEGPFTASACNGQPSNNCPYGGNSSAGNSSSSGGINPSLSSSSDVSSSSATGSNSSSSDGSSSSVNGNGSSSSVAGSSSSIASSNSSSSGGSSSSVATSVGSCNDFVDGTEREHYGMMKKQFCDSRDGIKYVYVEIGDQTWMAENLNYNASGSRCYDDDLANCDAYGRLYSKAMASENSSLYNNNNLIIRGVCPDGWHLPREADWIPLIAFVESDNGCTYCAGKYLKATSGWNSNGNGEDTYGFSALPGGMGYISDFKNFQSIGTKGGWWSNWVNTYDGSIGPREMLYFDDSFRTSSGGPGSMLWSVRCVQDLLSEP